MGKTEAHDRLRGFIIILFIILDSLRQQYSIEGVTDLVCLFVFFFFFFFFFF